MLALADDSKEAKQAAAAVNIQARVRGQQLRKKGVLAQQSEKIKEKLDNTVVL